MSLNRGKLSPILRNASKLATNLWIQDVYHKGFGRHVPFAAQPTGCSRLKPKARIEGRMADDGDEWTPCVSQMLNTRFHKAAANALPLMTWDNRHGSQPYADYRPHR